MQREHRQNGALLGRAQRDIAAIEAKFDQTEKVDLHVASPSDFRVKPSLVRKNAPRYTGALPLPTAA
jgi:hypothetical protein